MRNVVCGANQFAWQTGFIYDLGLLIDDFCGGEIMEHLY